ncbi:MAG: phosphoribosylaminoimidazolesuccinocarboxamide synthase, partial [Nanoarchaeota archaeon]
MIDEKTLKSAEIIEKTNFSIGQREQTDQWDIYTTKDAKILIATDRVVAFDRIIGTVPYKGSVTAAATAFFAEFAADICQTDFITQPHPRVLHIKNSVLFPVSFHVHGYINNENNRKPNMWEQYKNGVKNYFGNILPAGLKENQKLESPIIVPTVAKNATTQETIFAEGLVDEALFEEAEEICMKLFAQGTAHATKQGLILASA